MVPNERFLILQDRVLSEGIGTIQPCALVTSVAISMGEIVPVSWYDDS
jgi:hypothetical protein